MAVELARDFDELVAEIISFAESCSAEEWRTLCPEEERTVGVVFDHIADGYVAVDRWITSHIAGRPVLTTPDAIHEANAIHARTVADRPQAETIAHLRESALRTSDLFACLTEEQLHIAQPFGPAGGLPVETTRLVALASRHGSSHFESIRSALGR
jgi:hypothetical protein